MPSMTKLKYTIQVFLMVFTVSACAQRRTPPETKVTFVKMQLLDKYVSEGASIADINADGNPDIVAGPLWWKGPSFTGRQAYAEVKYFPITGPGLEGYATNFFTFPDNIDGDQWLDILLIGIPGTDSQWIQNPGKINALLTDSVSWPPSRKALKNVCHESPVLVDVIGDEKKELLAFSEGKLVLGIPNGNEQEAWKSLSISSYNMERFSVFSHGLGTGDINGDGLTDVLEKSGWWQQPENWDMVSPWTYRPYAFSQEIGGAQMFAFDVDGDGDNDVVSALNGHGYGLSWYEQQGKKEGITFKEHKVMTDSTAGNEYGVCFSQLHAMESADIDGDGIPDIVTGKCYYAHNGRDPGAEEPAVLYWFKTVRNADGSTDLVPYQIDNDSGVGRQIAVGDLNNDNKIDIVTANKKGVFAFIQE